jgi:hypothetical protein
MAKKSSAAANPASAGREPSASTSVRARAGRRSVSSPAAGTVTMQARIDAGFARELVEHDAVVLGLDGPSELVREGLRLLHRRAREMDVAAAYDEFYSGRAAPLPAGVVAADPE